MRNLLYLDTETLGLGLDCDIWEIGWAFNDEPVEALTVRHEPYPRDEAALEINGYNDRMVGVADDAHIHEQELLNRIQLSSPTLVGANPSFDAQRLAKRWGINAGDLPWKYRMIDVSVYAMAVLGHELPKGLYAIVEELQESHWTITQADHSAANDVESVRDVFKALQSIAKYGHRGTA